MWNYSIFVYFYQLFLCLLGLLFLFCFSNLWFSLIFDCFLPLFFFYRLMSFSHTVGLCLISVSNLIHLFLPLYSLFISRFRDLIQSLSPNFLLYLLYLIFLLLYLRHKSGFLILLYPTLLLLFQILQLPSSSRNLLFQLQLLLLFLLSPTLLVPLMHSLPLILFLLLDHCIITPLGIFYISVWATLRFAIFRLWDCRYNFAERANILHNVWIRK